MEEQEKGLCGVSESTVTHEEKVRGENLEGSMDCVGEVLMEGSFSEDLVGEGDACNGKDVMLEVLGSDVYIDGVCTHENGAELSGEVGDGGSGSVEAGEGLGKDVRSGGVGSGDPHGVESEEGRRGNVAVDLDSVVILGREDRDEAVDVSVENVQSGYADNGAIGDGVSEVAVDTALPSSEENQCLRRCNEKEQMSDTGQGTKEELNKDVSDAEECGLHEGIEVEAEGQPKTESTKTTNQTSEIEGEDTQIADQDNHALMDTRKEEVHDESNIRQNIEVQTGISEQVSSNRGQEVEELIEAEPLMDAKKEEVHNESNIRQNVKVQTGLSEQVSSNGGQEVEEFIEAEPLLDAGKEEVHDESNIRQNVEVQTGIFEQVSSNGGQEVEVEVEEFIEAEPRKVEGRVTRRSSLMKSWSLETSHHARYLLPTEKEGGYSVSDMVWGKVRSHPWWPGQIFDPSDSSEKAMKHYKKDCHLVAYFGDRTFAWNEESQLKPFRTHFSSIEKQSTSESFQNAVDCAMDEVTRRAEYGLACSCIPKDTYDSIKFQTVENTGIRPDLSVRHGVDESLNASSFSPGNLLEYLKSLSVLPTGGFDRLELGISKAQLLAFYRFKGYSCLPELQYCGGFDDGMDTLVDDDENKDIDLAALVSNNDGQAGSGLLKNQSSSRRKRKHNLKDIMHETKKERSLSELMGGTPDSPDGDYWFDEMVTDSLVSPGRSKKRRAIDHYADEFGKPDGRKTISVAKVSNTTKPSFLIGDRIRRVASKLTGSPSMVKSTGYRSQKTDGSADGFSANGSDFSFEEAQRSSMVAPTEYSSLDDLLSSLHSVAEEPLGDYSFLNPIVSFFSDFRNSIVVADDSVKDMFCKDKVGTKRKKPPTAGSPETFEFEDMSDTYWTDRVIDNGSEAQPAQPVQPSQQAQPVRRNRKKDHQLVPAEPGKPVQVSRRPYSRKEYSNNNHIEAPEKPGYIDENAPAELVMNFAELGSVPSETNLNKMFRHFGPLKETETEVDTVSSRARVVFKKCVDAEVACSSAQKFNIFGPILVNYQLNYTPSALFKALPVATTQDQEMHLDLSNFEVNMV